MADKRRVNTGQTFSDKNFKRYFDYKEKSPIDFDKKIRGLIGFGQPYQRTDNIDDVRLPLQIDKIFCIPMSYPLMFGNDKQIINAFYTFFSQTVTKIPTAPDGTMNVHETTSGPSKMVSVVPSNLTKSWESSFTISTKEAKGSPTANFLDYWANGISDEQSGVRSAYGYPGIITKKVYSCDFIMGYLNPEAKDIIKSFMYINCFPTVTKGSHIDVTEGEVTTVDAMDVTFSGTYAETPYINMLSSKIINALQIYKQDRYRSMVGHEYFELLNKSDDDIRALLSPFFTSADLPDSSTKAKELLSSEEAS